MAASESDSSVPALHGFQGRRDILTAGETCHEPEKALAMVDLLQDARPGATVRPRRAVDNAASKIGSQCFVATAR